MGEEDLRLIEERMERERLRFVPRPCELCSGTGSCRVCHGEGTLQTYYLAPTVNGQSTYEHGCRPRGCEACGGFPADWGNFHGTGKCEGCKGAKKVKPPPGGWQSPPPEGWPK